MCLITAGPYSALLPLTAGSLAAPSRPPVAGRGMGTSLLLPLWPHVMLLGVGVKLLTAGLGVRGPLPPGGSESPTSPCGLCRVNISAPLCTGARGVGRAPHGLGDESGVWWGGAHPSAACPAGLSLLGLWPDGSLRWGFSPVFVAFLGCWLLRFQSACGKKKKKPR